MANENVATVQRIHDNDCSILSNGPALVRQHPAIAGRKCGDWWSLRATSQPTKLLDNLQPHEHLVGLLPIAKAGGFQIPGRWDGRRRERLNLCVRGYSP